MANNRTGILASRYAFIKEPQQTYAPDGGRHTASLQSPPSSEPTATDVLSSTQTNIDSLQNYTPDPLVALKKRDLNASIYAPHNYHKPENVSFRQSAPRRYLKDETVAATSQYSPKTATPMTRAPVFAQQGHGHLPYKVQHRVLTAIQNLLEEACYDFAVKWLPHVLEEMNWTCSEAVEMAKWKTVLSGPLPEGSITLSGRYSINHRLGEAVRIRNITQHREPCDNNSIRKMISSAQNLVEIFSDHDRVNRLGRLRDEIDDWERSEGLDHLSATKEVQKGMDQDPRRKLHDALQEITEHPFAFDEMDWAPNADTPDEPSYANVEDFRDEMEWE